MAEADNTDPHQPARYFTSERRDMLPYVPPNTRRLLDVGCGAGGFLATVSEAFPTIELWGIEPSDAVESAAQRFRHVQAGLFPDDFQAPESYFDAVFFNDVLEHMYDPWKALRAVRRWLTDDATVVASLPSVRNYATIFELLVRGRWRYVDQGVLDYTHVRFFTPQSIRELFDDSGFVVEQMSGSWPLTTRKMALLDRLTSLVAPKAAAELRHRQWVVVARPA